MKKIWGTRVLAMLLVLALAVGLMPTVLASESKESVTFKQVSNDMLERSIARILRWMRTIIQNRRRAR